MRYSIKSSLFKEVFLYSIVVSLIFHSDLAAETHFTKQETVLLSNAVGLTAITAWGILSWDYFQNDPVIKNEGWFSRHTKDGGADKLGHFYTSYAFSHIFSSLYEHVGYTNEQGAFLGSLSALCMTTWMELGDSFSVYGFSYEDAAINLVGSLTGYLLYTQPNISEKIDFRIEYLPEFNKMDIFTDYEHHKFLMALKLDGFDFAKTSHLKYFELHLGYYTRGYSEKRPTERNIYLGVGLNISRIFSQLSMPIISRAANYIQVPYTYIESRRDLNR